MTDRNLIGFAYSASASGAPQLIESLMQDLHLGRSSWAASVGELEVERIEPSVLEATRLIVAAGGDGTIIRVNRLASPYSIPIVGINMGRVGFMAELTVDNAASQLPKYLAGHVRTEERLMIQASVTPRADALPRIVAHALNETIVRGALPRLLDVDVTIDGAKLATYRADGVIVSTPTGSTGYALSAGGPVLQPESKVLLIQPLAAHISLQTGLVVPDDSSIELTVAGGGEAMISVDNFTTAKLCDREKVVIQKSPYIATFLRSDDPSAFYSNLTRKLGVHSRTTYHEQ